MHWDQCTDQSLGCTGIAALIPGVNQDHLTRALGCTGITVLISRVHWDRRTGALGCTGVTVLEHWGALGSLYRSPRCTRITTPIPRVQQDHHTDPWGGGHRKGAGARGVSGGHGVMQPPLIISHSLCAVVGRWLEMVVSPVRQWLRRPWSWKCSSDVSSLQSQHQHTPRRCSTLSPWAAAGAHEAKFPPLAAQTHFRTY